MSHHFHIWICLFRFLHRLFWVCFMLFFLFVLFQIHNVSIFAINLKRVVVCMESMTQHWHNTVKLSECQHSLFEIRSKRGMVICSCQMLQMHIQIPAEVLQEFNKKMVGCSSNVCQVQRLYIPITLTIWMMLFRRNK